MREQEKNDGEIDIGPADRKVVANRVRSRMARKILLPTPMLQRHEAVACLVSRAERVPEDYQRARRAVRGKYQRIPDSGIGDVSLVSYIYTYVSYKSRPSRAKEATVAFNYGEMGYNGPSDRCERNYLFELRRYAFWGWAIILAICPTVAKCPSHPNGIRPK